MKKAIEKAMKNELDIIACAVGTSPEDISDESHICIPKADEEEYHVINIYELIFKVKLGFIDKLVGNKVICTRHGRGCLRYCNISKMFEKGKEGCYSTVGEKELLADYHREQLANMTLDEMKVYIRGLVC